MATTLAHDTPAGLPISLWLLPDDNSQAPLQTTINELAVQYATPPFTPHVTLLSAVLPTDLTLDRVATLAVLKRIFSDTAAIQTPLSLDALRVSSGPSRFQCVFLDLPTAPVRVLAQHLAQQLSQPCGPWPGCTANLVEHAHLSLIYASQACLASPARTALAARLKTPSGPIRFNRIALVLPGNNQRDFSKPALWQQLAPMSLGKPN